MSVTPDAILRLLDELEANRKSRKSAWATLQRLRKFLEEHGARIGTPEERTFESEGEVIETGLRRTVESRDMMMRSLIRAVYRFRDATLVAEKKDDFGPFHSFLAVPCLLPPGNSWILRNSPAALPDGSNQLVTAKGEQTSNV
jgi:hypothetical protein